MTICVSVQYLSPILIKFELWLEIYLLALKSLIIHKFDVFKNSQYKESLTRRSSNKSILFGLSYGKYILII